MDKNTFLNYWSCRIGISREEMSESGIDAEHCSCGNIYCDGWVLTVENEPLIHA